MLREAFEARHSPLEATLGMRHESPTGVVVAMGLGAGLTPGYGAPDARVLTSLGYRWLRRHRRDRDEVRHHKPA